LLEKGLSEIAWLSEHCGLKSARLLEKARAEIGEGFEPCVSEIRALNESGMGKRYLSFERRMSEASMRRKNFSLEVNVAQEIEAL